MLKATIEISQEKYLIDAYMNMMNKKQNIKIIKITNHLNDNNNPHLLLNFIFNNVIIGELILKLTHNAPPVITEVGSEDASELSCSPRSSSNNTLYETTKEAREFLQQISA